MNQSTLKCGFPCSSYDKYSTVFKIHNLKIKIIETDNKIIYNLKDYNENIKVRNLLETIMSINTDTLSISETYKLIDEIIEKSKKIYLEVYDENFKQQ